MELNIVDVNVFYSTFTTLLYIFVTFITFSNVFWTFFCINGRYCIVIIIIVIFILFADRWLYVAGERLVDVGLSLKGWTSIMFQVRTAANARIALTQERPNFTDGSFYAINVGVDDNSRAIIRSEHAQQIVFSIFSRPYWVVRSRLWYDVLSVCSLSVCNVLYCG